MPEDDCLDFQSVVDEYLIRHRSVMDVMTKYQETTTRVNRALAKAVTECGCVSIHAQKQQIPADTEFKELKNYMQTHLSGAPCPACQEILSKEIGHSLFYLAALCNLTGLTLDEVITKECKNVKTLGVFNLT
ncbi:MAG: DUF1573 domain-containing protein [Sporomusaceae bacterium]|nr:DUF1573 domain-containing protein [Sporomusaceae bacterium]